MRIAAIFLLLFCLRLNAQNVQAWVRALESNVAPSVVAGGGTPTINNAWKHYTAATAGTLTVAPTAGHAVVLTVACSDSNPPGAVPSVSDNIDGTTGWVKCCGRTNLLGFVPLTVFIFWKASMASGVTTITATGGAGSGNYELIAHDVSNISAFTSTEINSAQLDGGTNPQTGTVNNGTATSIYFAAVVTDGTGSWTINATGTTGTWNHYSASSHEDDGNNFTATSMPNIVVSSSASRGHGWTCDTGHEAQCIAVFH